MRRRPREPRSRSRPGSVPAEGAPWGQPTAWGSHGSRRPVVFCLRQSPFPTGTELQHHSPPKPFGDPAGGYIHSIKLRKASAREETPRAHLCGQGQGQGQGRRLPSGPRSHCCLGTRLPVGVEQFLPPASRMCPYCQCTVRTPAGLDRRLACYQQTQRGTGVSRIGPNADWRAEGKGRVHVASLHCRVPGQVAHSQWDQRPVSRPLRPRLGVRRHRYRTSYLLTDIKSRYR